MQQAHEENGNDSDKAKASKKRRSLKLPDSYKKERLKLDLESKEVYLIRAPADFNMQQLDGKRISLDTGTYHIASAEGLEVVADVVVDDDTKNPLVVAQSTDGSLVKGTICVRRKVSVPDPVLPEVTGQVRCDMNKHLKQRYVPFGSVDTMESLSSHYKVQHQKKKKVTKN